MFKQPTFKEYNFTWKLIPRDPKEARTINSIIRALKYAMLPDINVDNGGTLLEYPYIIQTNFYGNDNYLYKFKPAAIKNVTVNYAPATTPSFFKGSQNVPTEVELKIHMIEIEYWTKQDIYENDPNLSVELTEAEKAIDEMIAKEDLKGGQKKLDVNKNGKLDADDFKKLRGGKKGMEEGEEMTAKEKKFAALAEPKDKIDAKDLAALRAKKKKKK